MRVALAQLNPVSGDIDGNARKILAAIEEARRQEADLVVTPEMALPGYCIGDLVEDADFLAANERAIAAHRAGRARHHRGRRLHRLRPAPAQRQRHGPEVQRRGGRPRRPGPAARAQVAAAQLPLFRRQAVLRPGRERASRSTCPAAAARRAVGVSICEDMWDDFYEIKPLPRARREGRGGAAQPQRVALLSRQAARARRADPPAHRRSCASRSSTSTPPAPPTTARTSSRSTARAWSTTGTAG